MRWRSCRSLWLFKRSRNSGWPIRTICNSLRSSVSMFEINRTCSSNSSVKFCASSTIKTVSLPASVCFSKKSLMAAMVSIRSKPFTFRPYSVAMARINSSAFKHRIHDQGGGIMSVELFQQGPAQGRFARADFAGELHKALALADAVEQMIERLAVLGAVKKEARVRRDVERRLLQSIKLQIHPELLAETDARCHQESSSAVS